MWREIRFLAASKPDIASMADVAASGGYYMAMATGVIVAEDLTLTGSIGVVTGEPSNSHSYGFFDIVRHYSMPLITILLFVSLNFKIQLIDEWTMSQGKTFIPKGFKH